VSLARKRKETACCMMWCDVTIFSLFATHGNYGSTATSVAQCSHLQFQIMRYSDVWVNIQQTEMYVYPHGGEKMHKSCLRRCVHPSPGWIPRDRCTCSCRGSWRRLVNNLRYHTHIHCRLSKQHKRQFIIVNYKYIIRDVVGILGFGGKGG